MKVGNIFLCALFATIFLNVSVVFAQTETPDLQLVVVTNDGVHLDLKIQIKSTNTFGFADGNLVFTFTNPTNFSSSTVPFLLNVYNFSGGNYSTMTLTNPTTSRTSVNIVYNGGGSTSVGNSWVDVATVRMTVTNPAGSSTFAWKIVNPNKTHMYKDMGTGNQPADLPYGTLAGLVVNPLPVQLTSFNATLVGNTVHTSWTTETEVNSYGFDVERSSTEKDWIKIGFVEGHGTSNTPSEYHFVDNNIGVSPVLFYRLKMIDRDGSSQYSDVATVKTGMLPTKPMLHATYPNPFNATAMVHFSIPSDQAVSILVYDAMGREVQRLYDNESLAAGYYSRPFDAASLPSGKYVVRMIAGSFTTSESILLQK